MRRHLLSPQGQFPAAGLMRRLAAMFYDSLLCIALMMVVTLFYQQVLLRLLYGSDQLKVLADAGRLDIDPLLSTLLLFSLFGFFATRLRALTPSNIGPWTQNHSAPKPAARSLHELAKEHLEGKR